MRALAVIAILCGAAPAASAAETLTQHHEWARKFEPIDPDITGSVGLLRPDVEVRTGTSGCPRGAARFDELPFEHWRIIQCQRPDADMRL